MTKRRHLPTGAKIPFEKNMTPSEGFDPSGKNVSVHCPAATLCENGKSFRGAILTDLAAEAEIVYEIDEIFKHWSLWNSGGNENFFCPEPQSCMINAPNLALPEDITGFSSLNPGEKKETVCRISLRKLC
jgi:aldose 1-epimerase